MDKQTQTDRQANKQVKTDVQACKGQKLQPAIASMCPNVPFISSTYIIYTVNSRSSLQQKFDDIKVATMRSYKEGCVERLMLKLNNCTLK